MGRLKDTDIGGGNRKFPTTIWSNILEAADRGSPRNRQQVEKLLRDYWKPVYLHIRLGWSKSVEDAKDLTQAFFSHLLEKEFLSRLRPDLGSFRSYLKRSVKNFVIDTERSAAARRPDGPLFSLETSPGELEKIGPASPDETPDRAYDREWFDCLFEAGLKSLKTALESEKKPLYWEVFRLYCLEPLNQDDGGGAPPTYRDIAAKLHLKETDVRNYLTYCRRSLQNLLRERIREYALTESEVEQELELALRI